MHASVSIKDICTTTPVRVSPETPISDVFEIMQDRHISSVIVVEGHQPIGIFTERDTIRIFANHQEAQRTPVRTLMSTPLVTVPDHIDFFEAYHLCAQKDIRHLVIVDHAGHLYGVATDTDFMKVLGLDVLSGKEQVTQVMSHAPLGIAQDASLNDAIAMMHKFKAPAVVVVDHGEPVGIVTERDMVRFGLNNTPGNTPLSSLMRTPVLTTLPEKSIYHAIEIMREQHIRTLAVVDHDNQFLGILSEHDVVKKIENHYVSVLTTIIKRQSDDINRIRHELDEKHVLSAVLHQSLGVGLVVADPAGNVHYMNPAAGELFGLQPSAASGVRLRHLFETVGISTDHFQPSVDAAQHGACYEYELGHHSDGENRELHLRMAPIQDQNGRFLGMVQAIQDVTEKNHSERKLKQAASIFENTIEGVIIADAHANILSVNPAFTRITGFEEDEVRGQNPRILGSGRQDRVFYERMWNAILGNGYWQGEIWNRRKNGEAYAEWLTISVINDTAGKPKNYIAVFADITSTKRVHDEFEFLAHHDPLTKLPNRLLLNARLAHSLSRAIRARSPIAVLMLDLDGFKLINDQYGHEAGDRVLETVATRLASRVRGEDTVSRLGGDEFAIVLEDLEAEEVAISIAHKLIDALSTPMAVADTMVTVTVSIGIAFSSPSEKNPGNLLKNADEALYIAKNAGKNTCHIHAIPDHQESHA